MAVATISDASTIIGDSVLGRIWRRIIVVLDWPTRRAASTYSRLRSDINSARTKRATGGQLTIAIASTIEVMLGCMMATSTIASAKLGMVWKNSVKRIKTSSMMPP